MQFIELLTVLVAIIFGSKIIARATKTVDIIWYIVFGLIGTQYLFHIDSSLLENWSTLGVVFIMFYAGWKEELLGFLLHLWKNKWVTLLAAIGPFLGGLLAFWLLGFEKNEALVAGFIFTSSAVPYTVALLRNLGLEKTKAAETALSSAVGDNFLSILIAVGILPAIALTYNGDLAGQGLHDILASLSHEIGLIFLAFIIFAGLGLIILPDKRMKMTLEVPNALQKNFFLSHIVYFIYKIRQAPGFNDIFSFFKDVRIGIPMTLFFVFALSWLAHSMGLHPAIGAYLTGLILHTDMFKQHKDHYEEKLEEEVSINHKNLSIFFYFLQEWIGPIFFIYLGSQLVADWSNAWIVGLLAFIAALIVGSFQYWSAYLGGRFTSKLQKHDAKLLGFGMLPCDVVAFVVLGIASSVGLVQTDSPFVIVVVITILFINIATSILIRWYKPRYLKAEADLE